MRNRFRKFVSLFMALTVTSTLLSTSPALAVDAEPSVTLVNNGQATASIVVSVSASQTETALAAELASYMQQISGAEIPVGTEASAGDSVNIYVGSASPAAEENNQAIAAAAAAENKESDCDAYRLLVEAGAIHLNGLTDRGIQYAGYELLEQIGVRWYMPGEYGTVIPKLDTVVVKEQDTVSVPDFYGRHMASIDGYQKTGGQPDGINYTEGRDWARYNRINQVTYGREGWPNVKITNDLKLPGSNFLDVTNPDALEAVVAGAIVELKKGVKVVNMGPRDGVVNAPFDPEWDVKDQIDPANGVLSMSDRYVRFFNKVLDRLAEEGYPDAKIAFFAYSNYKNPPVATKCNERLIPVLANITMDRMHAIGNDLSWERNQNAELLAGWREAGASPMIYQYLYNLADPGTPFSMINQVAAEYKYYKDVGVPSIRSEVLPAWGYHGPSLYLASKMMWDADLDVDALMNEYFTTFYGPAAEAMQMHFNILEAAYANADYFAGSCYEIPKILTSASYVEKQKKNANQGGQHEEDKSACDELKDAIERCQQELREQIEKKLQEYRDKHQEQSDKIKDKIKDFFGKFFGGGHSNATAANEAAQTEGTADAKIEQALTSLIEELPESVIEALRVTLEAAEEIAANQADPVYAERIKTVRLAFDFGENFLGMMESMTDFNFVEANQKYEKALEIREESVLHSPVAINPYGSYLYIDWFWKNYAPQAAERVTNGNTMLTEMPDEWNAMLYPSAYGDVIGLQKPGLGTKSWMKLKTYSDTWSAQGLRYYKGYMWYRTTVKVPESAGNGNVFLWLGMVDDEARVWVNGKACQKVQGASLMKPFEYDITDAVRFGEENLVVVEVRNAWLDELGTGGLMGPSMIWQAAE